MDTTNIEIRLIIFFAAKLEKLYTVSKKKKKKRKKRKKRLGINCGSDPKLLIAKFRFQFKKVGKQLGHSGMT